MQKVGSLGIDLLAACKYLWVASESVTTIMIAFGHRREEVGVNQISNLCRQVEEAKGRLAITRSQCLDQKPPVDGHIDVPRSDSIYQLLFAPDFALWAVFCERHVWQSERAVPQV